jgi:hypothetical protein
LRVDKASLIAPGAVVKSDTGVDKLQPFQLIGVIFTSKSCNPGHSDREFESLMHAKLSL